MPTDSNRANGYVSQVIILWDDIQDGFEFLHFQQAERCVGILNPHMEHEPNDQTQGFRHKDTACSILSASTRTYLEIVIVAVIPHLPELLRQGLSVTIGLEDIIRLARYSIAV